MENKKEKHAGEIQTICESLINWLDENMGKCNLSSRLAVVGMLNDITSQVTISVIASVLETDTELQANLDTEDKEKIKKHIDEIRGRKKTFH
jgi:hypothetical protein